VFIKAEERFGDEFGPMKRIAEEDNHKNIAIGLGVYCLVAVRIKIR